MFQRTFEAYTSTTPEHLAKNAHNLFNITYDMLSHKVSEKLANDQHELASFSDDSVSTKDSEECAEDFSAKKSSISQKKSYKKAPQGKMDSCDEELLLCLASKYKHDWKKVSKKIFKLHKKKLGPNLLRIRYKELAPDLTQKRVRFTHAEDLLIVKLYSKFGYDWEKIASEFESRTSIMVKNRFYHIKKKNILQSLLNEVEATNSTTANSEGEIEFSVQPEIVEQEQQQIQQEPVNENNDETLHFFTQRGDEIHSQKLKVFSDETHGFFDEQLWDKVTPMGDWDNKSTSNFMDEDNGYSLTSFMNFNPRYFYF
jgi:hypothetical protein